MADQPQNIFGTPPPNPEGLGKPSDADSQALATLLGEIKNERGETKYKTLADALVALKHSQEFIPTLKSRETELEQKLTEALAQAAKVTELERTVLELTQKIPTATDKPPAAGLSAEQVAELVRNTLTETQTKATQDTNLALVVNKMKEVFGDKAETVFYDKAKELGITVAEINAMAAKSPKVVLTLIGADKSVTPTRQSASFNTLAFTPKVDTKIGKNGKTAMTGATSQNLREEADAAKAMVEELHAEGRTVHDLTDPKVFFKLFK